jgi:hypothetical protein
MITFFDVYSLGLLSVSLFLFVIRYLRADPPVIPYLVIACVCGVGNWLGEAGAGEAAFALLIAASFLFLACVISPYRSSLSEIIHRRRDA